MSSSEPPAPAPEPALADTVVPGPDDTAPLGAAPQIGERPEADALARAVARARIANKLFAKNEQVRLGRYHLLELVGTGGMGVVWGAWDPELERRVAIKLVKATMPAARDRIQLEGQALAKLSHPNVVTVYDVGVVDDQVYIVMEWVRGETLRTYGATPHTLRELVAIYRAAGDGLAAAHDAGLIHRDFKPDNAIRGDDGRVRVLDFGLARNEVRHDVRSADEGDARRSSDLTRGAGTPRYMPPEQAEGIALTPAADQYAFCVSLREALVGRHGDGQDADVPGWIAAILVRGTAREAKDRYPTMAELLRALARDPATIWRRRLIVGGALAATAAAFVIGNLRAAGSAVEPCSGSRPEIARTWNPAAQVQIVEHLQTLGAYGRDEAPRLGAELTRYAERWAASHHAACIASERGELTAPIYERNLGCLARARVGLATVVDVLAHVPRERLSNAVVASRGLPDTDRCLTETQSSTVEPPGPALAARAAVLGNELARLRVLAQAADPSVEVAAAALTGQAQELGYLPLLARAYLLQGLDLVMRDDNVRALPVLDRAATTAIDAGDQVTFVEAYAREVFGIATTNPQQQPAALAGALGAIPYVERIAHRLGAAASFERPLLLNNIGVSRMAAGDKAEARAWFTKAIDEPRTREGDLELVSAISNLALLAEPAERAPLLQRERDVLTALLGPNHVRTLEARWKAAAFTARPDAAAAQLRDVCQRASAYHAQASASLVSRCAYDLGWLAEERGDVREARAAMQQVTDNKAPIARAYVVALDGSPERAGRLAQAAVEGLQGAWWEKFYAGDAQLFAATCADRGGHRDDALASVRLALAIYEQLTMIRDTPSYLRRVARAKALLARLLAASARTEDRAEARRLAGDAATWYRAAGGYDAIAAALEQLARA
jgi:eukaryotic-like serine/threonine-protein kinase